MALRLANIIQMLLQRQGVEFLGVLRAELPVQRNRTLKMRSLMAKFLQRLEFLARRFAVVPQAVVLGRQAWPWQQLLVRKAINSSIVSYAAE